MTMGVTLRFALNHSVAPQLDLQRFFSLARDLGLAEVELRNDLAGKPIQDGTPPETVREAADSAGVRIISINSLQRFNDWTAEREEEARALFDYAVACGAKSVLLVPLNDGSGRDEQVRLSKAQEALAALKPMLQAKNLIGMIECLGFESCSLRLKSEAVAAIDAVDGRGVFRLVHDTFHHHLAGEHATFPELTGLVHISGVADPDVPVSGMQDAHRGLVDARDRVDNIEQIKMLVIAGVEGPYSFEPFAEIGDPRAAIAESMQFILAEASREKPPSQAIRDTLPV
jgi:2-keto-myo-inositol isomerase